MSIIINWFYKILGINTSNTNIDLPPLNIDVETNKSNDQNDNDRFEQIINNLCLSLELMLRELDFQLSNEDSNKLNIVIDSDQPSKESGIPDKNFSARNHFLNSFPAAPTSNEPQSNETMCPTLNCGQLVNRSCSYGTFDGRTIEKEFITRQLQDGIIEKVTLLKDGNQQCINTVTENLQTGHKTSVQQLINLDESQLNEFEKRFSKFM